MKLQSLLIFLFVGLLCNVNAQRNCSTMEYLEQQIQEDPNRSERLQQIEAYTREWIEKGNQRDVVTIPVVFHVVYNTNSENISDAQVLSQLNVLNEDFRRLNSDANNTWPQAADTEIEFCLASVDPNGNATSGITRTSTSVSSFSSNDNVKFNSSGGKDAWPASDYLNFWVCDLSGGLLGYAQFPGGPASTDGVVCDYLYTGTVGTATAPFNLGRTGTHEVGHWLNLRHIWGDGGCSVDDFVSDTPTSDASNNGCPTGHVSCGTTDMIENYMDYTDDACMNLFTAGQKSRMQALFGSGGSRVSLLSSGGCGGGGGNTASCTDGVQNGNETGVDCGGPDCPPCPSNCNDNPVVVTITFDNYPEETTWTITNSSGATVASGGPYGNQPDGSTINIDVCLVDDCYDFTINDSYGDGICCQYGNGSYSVTSNGSTLASGGSFGTSETTNFCFGGGPAPTCNDGVQNGSEAGVDCGGPDCPACPTCNDGVQNGNETGVDCGGPDCPACPTCNDGVQNGSETGVDCGGPDCPPCSSGCNDNPVDLTITFDNYPEETTWQITDASGSTVASGGPYGSQPDGSTLTEELCLADGCYDFTINDSYGDGICCQYGNGSYSVTNGSTTLASGGSFGPSETTNFCLGGGPAPTCNDGIQNGNETGVDCGGTDCPPCGGGSNTILAHFFETGWDGWADGGGDCFRYNENSAGTNYSYEGAYSIRLRDNSGTASSMTSSTYNVSGYSSLEIEFYFYPNSMENGEDFWVRYYDGSSWSTVASYASGSAFNNGSFYVATVTLNSSNYNFPTNAQFRFQCDASANQDQVYIDAVTITGNGNGSRTAGQTITRLGDNIASTPATLETGFTLHPNPVNNVLNVNAEETIRNISIYNVSGMLVKKISMDGLAKSIDVSDMRSGLYIISLETEDEVLNQKFVKR